VYTLYQNMLISWVSDFIVSKVYSSFNVRVLVELYHAAI